jgi:hypothetical protein
MSVETLITTIQIVCVIALVAGTPVYAYLKLLWRVHAAEKRARSERLGRLAIEAKLEQTVAALIVSEQRTVKELRDGVGPLDNPPPGIVPMLQWAAEHVDLVAQALATARGISGDKAEDEVDVFLTTELVSARADGIRYLIDVQDAANRRMRWRKQISYFCAGYTSTLRRVEPSLNATPEEVRASGALLPTTFCAPGYFTVRVRSDFAIVRTPLITLDERKRAIASLPHVSHHLTAADRLVKLREALDMVSEVAASDRSDAADADFGAALQAFRSPVRAVDVAVQVKHSSRAATEVADAERAQIMAAVHSGLTSHRQVARHVFGSPGGKGYSKVKQVCDELGLLIGAVDLEMLEA